MKIGTVIEKFEGDEVRAEVRVHEHGFGVSVVDLDEGEVVSTVLIYKAKDVAIAYAKRCAGVAK